MLTRDFHYLRSTKNTYVFVEKSPSADEGDTVVGTLYTRKEAFDAQPTRLRVTIEDIT